MSDSKRLTGSRWIVLSIGLLAAMVLILGAAAVPAAAHDGSHNTTDDGDSRLVVCPAGDTATECEYNDIQAAVDAADPGDTVFVTAGEYHPGGTITVSDTPNLTIAGAGRDATFLHGGDHHHDDGGSGHTYAATVPLYHEGQAHNPFTDPHAYVHYIADNPQAWAVDHAQNPVDRATTHVDQAQAYAGNQTGDGDGHHGDEYDAFFVTADNVTVRDLQIQDYNGNGVYYDGVRGFRVARVDAIDNGAYGIYAIRSTMGVFEDSYAEGHYDSGFYLGEVTRCDCVIRNVTAVENLIGYSGTGAGFITIEDSTWRDNAAGIVPNVLPNEPSPQIHLHVEDNTIVDNNNRTAFRNWHFAGSLHAPVGSGIIIGGGSYNTVEHNDIRNHDRAGVVITFMFTQPSGNAVIDNQFANNDLEIWWDGGGANNCFSGNTDTDGTIDYDAGTYWNQQGDLPECTNDNTATPPDPEQLAEIATPVVFGCELENAPTGDNCHVEEPAPHVHPPQTSTPTDATLSAMFGDEAGVQLAEIRAALAG